MKTKFLVTGILVILSIATFSQTQYEVNPDPKHPETKILKGIINKDLIKNDTAFKWYANNQKIYNNPDTAIVGALHRDNIVKYVVFVGTWCEDTQFILPKFFKLQEKAGIADDRITIFGVDRQKQTIGNIAAAMLPMVCFCLSTPKMVILSSAIPAFSCSLKNLGKMN